MPVTGKKLPVIFGITFVAIILVAAGCDNRRVKTTLDQNLTDATQTFMLLQQIEAGQLEDAKQTLRLELDAQILTIDALHNSADIRQRKVVGHLFNRVASYRIGHPANYTGQLAKPFPEVTAKVDAILKKAADEAPRGHNP